MAEVTLRWPVLAATTVPTVSVDEMRDLDRAMIEEFSIQLPQMMENAGRNLADVVRSLGPWGDGCHVCVVAGGGNNGGGGLVCGRHLFNWGADVDVVVDRPRGTLGHAAAHQIDTLERMGVPVLGRPPASADVVVDALIGYGLFGAPSDVTADLIAWTNEVDAAVVSLDIPSGLDATTGVPTETCVRATSTLTLALPKRGLLTEQARGVVGRLFLGDISVPPALYRRYGLRSLPFQEATIVELLPGDSAPPPSQGR